MQHRVNIAHVTSVTRFITVRYKTENLPKTQKQSSHDSSNQIQSSTQLKYLLTSSISVTSGSSQSIEILNFAFVDIISHGIFRLSKSILNEKIKE